MTGYSLPFIIIDSNINVHDKERMTEQNISNSNASLAVSNVYPNSQDETDSTSRRRRHRSFTERRSQSQSLPPLFIPEDESILMRSLRNFSRGREVNHEECEEESEHLFTHFVSLEIEREELHIPEGSTLQSSIKTPENCDHPAWGKYGREMRIMADEFAKSYKRKRIRQRANEVDMDRITPESFSDLLSHLFFDGEEGETGITRERLMVLFFFISDLVIRSLKRKLTKLAEQFFEWSMNFIRVRLARWVEQNGGWGHIFNTSGKYIKRVTVIGVCVVGAVIVYKYLFRNNG